MDDEDEEIPEMLSVGKSLLIVSEGNVCSTHSFIQLHNITPMEYKYAMVSPTMTKKPFREGPVPRFHLM